MIKHGVVQLQPEGIQTATLLQQEMLTILAVSFLSGGLYLLFEHSKYEHHQVAYMYWFSLTEVSIFCVLFCFFFFIFS